MRGQVLKNIFLLKSTNRLSTEDHSDFLAVYYKGLFLKVGFEYPFGSAKRKAHIVAKLFSFAG